MNRKKLSMVIRRAINGESAALEQLCQLYAKTILFQTRLLVRNKDDAEDVAQRVAIEMLRSIQNLKSPYAFRNWLQRLIVNACNKQNARTQRERERAENLDSAEAVVDESLESRPEERASSEDMRRYVSGYLDKLPPAQSVSLTLYYYEQLTYKEIADVMGVSMGSVASTISKAKKNLKEMLKDKNDQGVFGIVFLPPFLRSNVERTVIDEIESSVPSSAVRRFMAVCKLNISAIATGVGSTVATTSAWGALLAAFAGLSLLGGIGVGAYLLTDEEPVVETIEPVVTQEQPAVTPPEARITYSVEGEQFDDNPVNPLTVDFLLYSSEQIDGWILTDSAGTEIAAGGGYAGSVGDGTGDAGGSGSGSGAGGSGSGGSGGSGAGGAGTDDGQAANEGSDASIEDITPENAEDAAKYAAEIAEKTARGTYVDIAALKLKDGDYTLSWYLTNGQGGKSRVYWNFSIASGS
jgi:RNA polymerase sigma-70 factor (ECF subfamily)